MNFIDDGQGSARDGCRRIFLLPTTAVHVDTFSHLWSIIPISENLIFGTYNYPEFFDDEQLKRFNLILTGAACFYKYH